MIDTKTIDDLKQEMRTKIGAQKKAADSFVNEAESLARAARQSSHNLQAVRPPPKKDVAEKPKDDEEEEEVRKRSLTGRFAAIRAVSSR